MEIPEKIGWRRLFLSPQQKFMLDLQRLGSKNELDKVEKVIIFMEGLAPGSLFRKAKRLSIKAVINLYWCVTPKRIKVYKAKNPFLKEFLPWFPDEDGRPRYIEKLDGLTKNKVRANTAYGNYNTTDYTYSWKKAHYMMLDFKKQVEQEELQWKLEYELKKLKGEDPWSDYIGKSEEGL
jgi:hypothetical protein